MRDWVNMQGDVCVVCFLFGRKGEWRSSALVDQLISSDVCGSRVLSFLPCHHLVCHSFDVRVFK